MGSTSASLSLRFSRGGQCIKERASRGPRGGSAQQVPNLRMDAYAELRRPALA